MRASVIGFAILGMLCCEMLHAKAPNVLVLVADDQRADTIAALGNPDIETPSLDKLAKSGFNVSSMYCLGSNSGAVCQPSRNMMLSGRSYFRWTPPGDQATYAPADDTTLPAVFNKAGYETYHHGKRGNTAPLIHKQFQHSKYVDDFDARWSGQAGQEIVDDAINHLKQRSDEMPWLMWLEFAVPHDPRYAAKEYLNKYAGRQIKLPKNVLPMHPFDNGAVLVRDEWTALWPRKRQSLRDQWQDYYATITTFDCHVGRLIDHIQKTGELDNTIVVFTSDHGLGMGSHGLMGKQNVYDAGYKAPRIFAGPGITHGACDAPVYLMDIYPTLCELCKIERPQELDGRSFATMLTSKSSGPRDAVMLSYQDSQRAVRQGDWKWIVYPKVGKQQLFNLKNDPQEMHDLCILKHSDHQEQIRLLESKLGELQKEFGDTLDLQSIEAKKEAFEWPRHERAQEISVQNLLSGKQWTTKGVNEPNGVAGSNAFVVYLAPGQQFAAIAVGYDRENPSILTGLRFDISGSDIPDGRRKVVIVGDINARWAPLLDGFSARLQPIGIFGHAGRGIESLGFVLSDNHRSPEFGMSRAGRAFELTLDSKVTLQRKLIGFYGTTAENNGKKFIESIGVIYEPIESSNRK